MTAPTEGAVSLKFGERVRNVWAGAENPTRDGTFVEMRRHKTGRYSFAIYARLTDGKGKFWETDPNGLLRHSDYTSREELDKASDELQQKFWQEKFGQKEQA